MRLEREHFYDADGIETGDFEEAVVVEVIVSDTERRWVPVLEPEDEGLAS